MVKWSNDYGATKVFLFLTILLAPLYVVRFNIGQYPSTLLEVLIGLTVVSWVFEKRGIKGLKGINAPTALLLFSTIVSVFVSPDKRGGLGILKAYFVEPILVYLVIKNVVKSRKDWWLVWGALGLSGVWVALLAVFQGLTGWLIFAPHEAALGRAHAVYNTANAVGLYLGPIVMLLLGVWQNLKSQNLNVKAKTQMSKLRWLVLLAIFVMILAIILSKSSGALVGLVVALLLPSAYCLLPTDWRRWAVRVAGIVALVAGVWFFFNISHFTPKNVDPYVRESTDTLQFRLCLWEGTKNLLLDRPVFGAGLSGFKELYSQKYFTCDAEPLEYPHNWVLNFWVETGALGLIAFLLILWRYFKVLNGYMVTWLNGCWGDDGDEKPCNYTAMSLCFFVAMVYWLVHGLVDVPYFKNDLSLEFFVIVGLAETLGFVL